MYFLIWVEHGNSYRSEVAFDDILLRPRTCQKIPSAPPLPEHPNDKIRRFQAEENKKNWKPLGTTTKKTPFTTPSPVKVLVPKFARLHPKTRLNIDSWCWNNHSNNLNMEGRNSKKYICCAGIQYTRNAGNACCGSTPYFVRKQVCCRNMVIYNKRKFSCCGGQAIHKSSFQCCMSMPIPRIPGGLRCCNHHDRNHLMTNYNPFKGEKCCKDRFNFGRIAKKTEKCCGMKVVSGEFEKCCGQGLAAKVYDPRYEDCCRSKSNAILFTPKSEICCGSTTYDSNEVCKTEIMHVKITKMVQFECKEKSNGQMMAVKTISKYLRNGSSPKSLPIWKNSCADDETCVSPNIDWLKLFLV